MDDWIELKWILSGCLFQHDSEGSGEEEEKVQERFPGSVIQSIRGTSELCWGTKEDTVRDETRMKTREVTLSLRLEGRVEVCHSANRRTYN